MGRTRLFVVDSRAMLRDSLRHMLVLARKNVDLVGEAASAEDALPQIKELLPDVVILNSDTAGGNATTLARQIRRYSPVISVILTVADEDSLLEAIEAGAAACVRDDASAAELCNLVEGVGRGEYPINDLLLTRPKLALVVLRKFQNLMLLEKEVESFISPLTPREKEILSLIARGNSNKQIARSLKISNQTVKNHMTSIMRKLAANDRAHAVVLALRQGMIHVD